MENIMDTLTVQEAKAVFLTPHLQYSYVKNILVVKGVIYLIEKEKFENSE